ncbi:MAG: ABC transporter substrate-binding protein [Peptostreptococcaceae bacterium]|jgi:NitT/TauT family transport system substrate-binding protein|nr:ABC transporter substrate-binding protein [Peptostreptococcaceae bacterium]
MRKRLILVLCLIFSLVLVSCNNVEKKDSKENETNMENETMIKEVNFIYPAGAPAITTLKFRKDNEKIMDTKINYNMLKTTDLLVSKLVSKEADIAIVPTNLASKLYNKGLDYKLVGSSVWGVLYLVSDEKMDDINKLKGKDIYAIGKGLTPDILLRYVLKQNEIDPDKDVNITYLSGATELVPSYISGKAKIALMPEPMLSTVMAKKETNIILDFQSEFGNKQNRIGYPQVSIIARGDILKDKDFMNEFFKNYKESISYMNENKLEVKDLAKEFEIGINENIIIKSLDRIPMNFYYAKDIKDSLNDYLTILYDFSKESVGGNLPKDDFYYEDVK